MHLRAVAQKDFVAVATGIALRMGSPSGTLGKPLGLVRAWWVRAACVLGKVGRGDRRVAGVSTRCAVGDGTPPG